MDIAAVILAGGKGTRMNEGEASPKPKVMFEVLGKPMIDYSISAVKDAGVDRVVLVVGYKKDIVTGHVGDSAEFVVQKEQLGTGHAAMMAKDKLEGETDAVIIFYGDMPLYKPETIQRLIEKYEEEKPTLAMLTVKFDDPEFWAYGRIKRDEDGNIVGIVEQKDCSPEELKIKESNPGFYIFDSKWLWDNIENLGNQNAQGEYYLTDMVGMAVDQGKEVIAVEVDEEEEVLGINTPEQLKKAEEVLRSRR